MDVDVVPRRFSAVYSYRLLVIQCQSYQDWGLYRNSITRASAETEDVGWRDNYSFYEFWVEFFDRKNDFIHITMWLRIV